VLVDDAGTRRLALEAALTSNGWGMVTPLVRAGDFCHLPAGPAGRLERLDEHTTHRLKHAHEADSFRVELKR
jgi:hypothetical protein